MFSEVLKLYLCLLILPNPFSSAIVAPNETNLIFYYGPKYSDSKMYQLSELAEILKNPHFQSKNKTHLYISGWNTKQQSGITRTVLDGYFKRKDLNIIMVNWTKAATQNYLSSSLINIELLAPVLADSILNLDKAGLNRKDLMVVGHSLGCQLAGMTGKQMILKTNGKTKIHYLTVLDPAFLLFPPPFTVDKNDAEYVQAIHTNPGRKGQPVNVGHSDFWANPGRVKQPGCNRDICSHNRAILLWIESVVNVDGKYPKFLGLPKQSYLSSRVTGEKTTAKPVEMGINCPMSVRGTFYLNTNSKFPFAKGVDGY